MEDLDEKKKLQLFTQLYENSKPRGNEGIPKLKEKSKIYDINLHLNYKIMKKILDKQNMEDEDISFFNNFYRNYIQTLFYEQKLEIINKIEKRKNKLITQKFEWNKKSFIDSYFDILKQLQKIDDINKVDYDEIIILFHQKYYVNNNDINIPLIYGTNELVFAGLINNLYHRFFFDKELENIDIKDVNVDPITGYINYPKNIMNKLKTYTETDNSVYISMDIDEELSDEKTEFDDVIFYYKLQFIRPFLDKIISDDFKEIFNIEELKKENSSNSYQVKPKMNALIFHLIYLELIFHIYNIYGQNHYLFKFNDKFYFETKHEKFGFFKAMNKIQNEVIITDEKGNFINNEKDIMNKNYFIYNVKNKEKKIEFNPYDYILTKFKNAKTFDDLYNRFTNIENYSLNKFYKENRLFEDKSFDSLFKNNIKEMLSSNTIKELFNQYINSSDYECPYSGDEKQNFIEQTFDIIYYFPIPFSNIAGFTYKKFGLIFINNIDRLNRKINYQEPTLANNEFCLQINKICFKKVVHIHEIVSHYSCDIIHLNNNDYGDKTESVLLGNKIKNLYTKGALFIINNNNYTKNLDEFNKDFIKRNEYKNEDNLDLLEESKKSQLIKKLIKKIYDKDNYPKEIKLEKKHITSFRVFENQNNNNQVNELSLLNISYFDNPTHVFTQYRKIK